MSTNPSTNPPDWRIRLPVLTGRFVRLREPAAPDVRALVELLSLPDATLFGLDDITELTVLDLIDRAVRDRASGFAFTYAITLTPASILIGLAQVRELDPGFEAAEWEMTLAPSARGKGFFVDAAQLIGSFAFGPVGAHRLEARVPVQNGRASGALRKLGAVQEGILRRSRRRNREYIDQVLWSMLKEDWGDHWVPIAPRVH